jgi:hypothetical protein
MVAECSSIVGACGILVTRVNLAVATGSAHAWLNQHECVGDAVRSHIAWHKC